MHPLHVVGSALVHTHAHCVLVSHMLWVLLHFVRGLHETTREHIEKVLQCLTQRSLLLRYRLLNGFHVTHVGHGLLLLLHLISS